MLTDKKTCPMGTVYETASIEHDSKANAKFTDAKSYTETAVIDNGGNTDCQNYSETAVMKNFGNTDCQNYTETAVMKKFGNTDCQNYSETAVMKNFGNTDCQNYSETAVMKNFGNTDCQNYSETAVMKNFGNTDCQNYTETAVIDNGGNTDCQNYTETAVIENGGNTDCQNYNIETDIMENFGKTDCQNYTETAVIDNGGNTDCQNYSETDIMKNFGNTDCQNYSETDIMKNFGNTDCQNYIEPVTANTETTGYEDNFSENVVMMEQTFMETPRFLENTSGSCFNEIESGLTVKSLSEARKESGVTSYKEILKKAWFSKRTGPNSKGNDEDADIWENIDKTGSCESKEYWELAVPSPLEQTGLYYQFPISKCTKTFLNFLDLLLEQEYRIHDLQARKEAIFDAVFQKLTAHPR